MHLVGYQSWGIAQYLKICCTAHNCVVAVAFAHPWLAGDRSGHIILWDTTSGAECWRIKGAHSGHVTALAWFDYSDDTCAGCFASGGQDGYVHN